MKRILFLLFAIGLTVGTTAMAGMSTSKVRKETRFLTDKMAYELSLSTQQYNDAYEINYDFIYSVRNIMDYVARGYEWALDDYYEALDIRNDDLRWGRSFIFAFSLVRTAKIPIIERIIPTAAINIGAITALNCIAVSEE